MATNFNLNSYRPWFFKSPNTKNHLIQAKMLSTGVGTRCAVVDNFDLIALSLNLTFSELRPPKNQIN